MSCRTLVDTVESDRVVRVPGSRNDAMKYVYMNDADSLSARRSRPRRILPCSLLRNVVLWSCTPDYQGQQPWRTTSQRAAPVVVELKMLLVRPVQHLGIPVGLELLHFNLDSSMFLVIVSVLVLVLEIPVHFVCNTSTSTAYPRNSWPV
jgi:hypothetical protein